MLKTVNLKAAFYGGRFSWLAFGTKTYPFFYKGELNIVAAYGHHHGSFSFG
jgi:hypothetical protein